MSVLAACWDCQTYSANPAVRAYGARFPTLPWQAVVAWLAIRFGMGFSAVHPRHGQGKCAKRARASQAGVAQVRTFGFAATPFKSSWSAGPSCLVKPDHNDKGITIYSPKVSASRSHYMTKREPRSPYADASCPGRTLLGMMLVMALIVVISSRLRFAGSTPKINSTNARIARSTSITSVTPATPRVSNR